MISDETDPAISQARATVLAWVSAQRPGEYPSNVDLARAFCALLPADVALQLQTVRNPSAMIFEARWSHQGRDVKEFPKPFCAEEEGDARILACAAIMQLPGAA